MKKLFFSGMTLLAMTFSLNSLFAQAPQEERNFKIPLIGENAPTFTAETTKGTITFPESLGRKWKILFSHPQDYTPVCSSELLELANMQQDFDDLNAKIVIISTDDIETHRMWVKSLEELNYKGRKTQKIGFPLVADDSKSVAKMYGMIHPATNNTKDVRGVFIIDADNVIQAILFYPMVVGRNMDEIKRTLIALQTTRKDVVATPANWVPGDDLIVPYKKPSREANEADGLYDVAWYLTLKKSN